VFVDEDLLPLVEPLAPRCPTVEQWIVCSDKGRDGWKSSLPGAVDYEEWIAGHKTEYRWPDLDENAPMGFATPAAPPAIPRA